VASMLYPDRVMIVSRRRLTWLIPKRGACERVPNGDVQGYPSIDAGRQERDIASTGGSARIQPLAISGVEGLASGSSDYSSTGAQAG